MKRARRACCSIWRLMETSSFQTDALDARDVWSTVSFLFSHALRSIKFSASIVLSLSLFRPTFILLIFLLSAALRLFLSHNLQSLPKSEGGTSRPVVVIRVFVGAPINRFTAQRLWTSQGPASSRHTVIKFKVASLTDSRSPFVSNLADRSKDLDDLTAIFGLDWASLSWIIWI